MLSASTPAGRQARLDEATTGLVSAQFPSQQLDAWVGERQQIDVAALLGETTLALENFDAPALERLLERAQRLSETPADAKELAAALPQRQVLRQLLAATDRNLKMLRRLRGENIPEEKMPWVR